MDLIRLYIYTGVPLLTCNMLFYSVSALSTSITSSQNVVKFISEHKKTDIAIFKEELDNQDLTNKLRIIETLIFDIIKRYCKSNEEFEKVISSLQCSQEMVECIEDKEFMLIELTNKNTVLNRIDEPIKLALMSTSETVQSINYIVSSVRDKVISHEQSYLNKLVSISLKDELTKLQKQSKLLDIRLHLLLELLKIYFNK